MIVDWWWFRVVIILCGFLGILTSPITGNHINQAVRDDISGFETAHVGLVPENTGPLDTML